MRSSHRDDLLALRGAGALSPEDEAELAEHMNECEDCRAGAEGWARLSDDLSRLPDPVPSPGLLARTRAAVERWRAEREERRWNRAALGFVIVFGWTLTGVAWLLMEIFVGALASRVEQPVGSTAFWFGVYLIAGWVTAVAAAVLLGRRTSEEGRFA